MMGKRLLGLSVLLTLFIPSLTGCWDRVDIEERAFVMAVGVDLPEPVTPGAPGAEDADGGEDGGEGDGGGGGEQSSPPEGAGQGGGGEKPASPLDQAGKQRFKMTLEIPIVKNLAGGGESKGGGGGKTWIVSSTGSSLFEINREFSTRLRRAPFYGHLRILIVGEDAARQGLVPLLDFFQRGTEMQRKIKLVIAQGKASDILLVNQPLQSTVADLISGELENIGRTSRLFDMDIGRFRTESTLTDAILIPRVKASPDQDEVKTAGSAVIRNMRQVGWLGEVETTAAVLAMGRSRGGIVSVPAPPGTKGDGAIVYEILRETTTLDVVGDGENISLLMRINLEGNIAEQTAGLKVLDADLIAFVENQVEKIVATEVAATVQKLQKTFEADVFGFARVVQRARPQTWKTIKSQWDEKFRDIPVEVRVTANVRRIGLER